MCIEVSVAYESRVALNSSLLLNLRSTDKIKTRKQYIKLENSLYLILTTYVSLLLQGAF